MSLKDIEAFFAANDPGDAPVILDQATTITNPRKFVEVNIQILKANPGNSRLLPYYNRLEKLYKIKTLENGSTGKSN